MPDSRSAALVTGSTSGIGLAIALRLARTGYAVTLSYANDDDRAAAALSLCREADPSARLVKADIGTADGAAALVREAVAASGRLDVLVNNAARVIDKATFDDPLQYSEGIQFVLVNGTPVLKDGQLVDGVFPGKAARAPISH